MFPFSALYRTIFELFKGRSTLNLRDGHSLIFCLTSKKTVLKKDTLVDLGISKTSHKVTTLISLSCFV